MRKNAVGHKMASKLDSSWFIVAKANFNKVAEGNILI